MPDCTFAAGGILKHLSDDSRRLCGSLTGGRALILGRGPFDHAAITAVLDECGVVLVDSPSADCDVVILGHEGWRRDEVERVARLRAGERLRVYSHEMLIASLAAGHDVYEGSRAHEVSDYGYGHPGLHLFRHGLGVSWPFRAVPRPMRPARRYAPEPDSGYSGGITIEHVSRWARGSGSNYGWETAAVMGSGPFDERSFGRLTSVLGAERVPMADSPEVVVVGQDDWDDEVLDEVIAAHVGGTIRIYSQEMVLSCLIADADLFSSLEEQELVEYVFDHPALEYVVDGPGFSWPTTEVDDAYAARLSVDGHREFADLGLLGALGYRVGYYRGLPTVRRRRILDEAFRCEAGSVAGLSRPAALAWGRPLSSRRLKRIAYTIAWFVRSRRARADADSYDVAISDWELDLDYLKATYYGTRFDFHWPSTRVAC